MDDSWQKQQKITRLLQRGNRTREEGLFYHSKITALLTNTLIIKHFQKDNSWHAYCYITE